MPNSSATRVLLVLIAGAAIFLGSGRSRITADERHNSGTVLLSSSRYEGTASTVTVGETLPPGTLLPPNKATNDGAFPGVFLNAKADGSFGVTSPIFIDRYNVDDHSGSLDLRSSLAVSTGQMVTSFSSKSELGLFPSTDGKVVTFTGYAPPINALDVSNSNTPNHFDATNPVPFSVQRVVGQIDADGHSDNVLAIPNNAYSGNNERAAIFDAKDNQYILAGNAGNGKPKDAATIDRIVDNTGVQLLTGTNPETQVVGNPQGTAGSTTGFNYGFAIGLAGYATPDKSGKDDNFRGATIFDNTLYTDKGSGGNGINTVYQVGTAGTLPTPGTASSTPITIAPGFNNVLASAFQGCSTPGTDPDSYPFGLWFANDHTLYVADEGDGCKPTDAAFKYGGLQKWVLESGKWVNVYTLTQGLGLGNSYSIGSYPATTTAGLRQLTGRHNDDGTVTLWSTTSTVSGGGDQGADPNQLVTITDKVDATSASPGEGFKVLRTAGFGEVLRGVAFIGDCSAGDHGDSHDSHDQAHNDQDHQQGCDQGGH
jgi:hypothetical protein